MKYKTFLFSQQIPDLIIEDGVTYIKVDEQEGRVWSGLWPGIAYERLDVVRAKGYDPDRTAPDYSGGRRGRSSGYDTHPGAGSDYHLFDESVKYESKLGPAINESLWQASLYRNLIHGKDDGIRGWPA